MCTYACEVGTLNCKLLEGRDGCECTIYVEYHVTCRCYINTCNKYLSIIWLSGSPIYFFWGTNWFSLLSTMQVLLWNQTYWQRALLDASGHKLKSISLVCFLPFFSLISLHEQFHVSLHRLFHDNASEWLQNLNFSWTDTYRVTHYTHYIYNYA